MKRSPNDRKTRLASLLAAALMASVLPLGLAQAEGDAAKGKKVFNKCKTCHSLEAGKNKIGPSLHGLFGRTAGSVEGFKYSDGMVESGIVWDEETIELFVTKPKDMMPGTKMVFTGLKKEDQRKDLVAYLMEATK
jgi:cytochrome c2